MSHPLQQLVGFGWPLDEDDIGLQSFKELLNLTCGAGSVMPYA
jgi:hypothetical protein